MGIEENAAAFLAELSAVAATDVHLTALGNPAVVAGADALDELLIGWRRDVSSAPLSPAWEGLA